MKYFFITTLLLQAILCSCGNENSNMNQGNDSKSGTGTGISSNGKFEEGKDYLLYERVRLMDNKGFTESQEAYSLLLPKGWQHQGEILWNNPGSACAGTYKKMKATSSDGKFSFEMLPDVIYSWNSDPEMRQFYQNSGGPITCEAREPMEAEAYLRNIFAAELGNAQVVSVEPNTSVVQQMQQMNAKAMSELQQYGAGQMDFNQTAVNAQLKWSDGMEGMVTLGITSITTTVPNVYNGTYSQIYTTQVTKRTVFKYPSSQSEGAKQQFAVIMSSVRTNPAWNDAVNNFWRQARQQSHTVHVGKIRMMDEQTRRIGEQAIRNGEQRLKDMDNQMRSWEQSQSSQDRMHTEFIKTIREVENFRDETGKYEMSSGYDHVWSRGDGNNFILTNNPNFDPSSALQDQRWKQMKKVQ